jgi:enoyl-CoA hydratase
VAEEAQTQDNVSIYFEGRVAIVTLNRPESLNALSPELLGELADKLYLLDQHPKIACSVLTGEGKAFAAGADIKAMAELNGNDILQAEWLDKWASIAKIEKPLIASVNGLALGGGFELALMCDIIYASKEAEFGLPEVTLGVIPGAGGTQRLTHALGKHRAMEWVLTGKRFTAQEAFEMGLINKVISKDMLTTTVMSLAHSIAEKPVSALLLAKEAVLAAEEGALEHGLQEERKRFAAAFDTENQKEGMKAFLEKRKAKWV